MLVLHFCMLHLYEQCRYPSRVYLLPAYPLALTVFPLSVLVVPYAYQHGRGCGCK